MVEIDLHIPHKRYPTVRGSATRGPAEIRASHEVLEFVRDKPDLSLQVMQLRDAGMSWLRVQEVLKAGQVKDVLESRSTWWSRPPTRQSVPVRG